MKIIFRWWLNRYLIRCYYLVSRITLKSLENLVIILIFRSGNIFDVFSSGIHLLALSWLGNFFFFFLFCWVGLEIFLFWQKYIRLSLNEEQDRFGAGFQTAVNREIFIGLTVGLLLTHKDTSGFMSNTLLIPKQDLSRV